jgi:hypothetical protein
LVLNRVSRPDRRPNLKTARAAQTVVAFRTTPGFMPLDSTRADPDNRPAPYLDVRGLVHLPFAAWEDVTRGSSRFISVLCLVHDTYFDSKRTKAASVPRNIIFATYS